MSRCGIATSSRMCSSPRSMPRPAGGCGELRSRRPTRRASGRGEEITHNLLTLAGDRLFINTNLGVIAAVATDDGRIAWLRRYDRAAGTMHRAACLLTSIAIRRRAFTTAAWCSSLRRTRRQCSRSTPTRAKRCGRPIKLADTVNLLGVVDGILIATGNRLAAVDARSGRVRFVWPESETAGIRGFGRGVVAGHEVFWPTRDKILCVRCGDRPADPQADRRRRVSPSAARIWWRRTVICWWRRTIG